MFYKETLTQELQPGAVLSAPINRLLVKLFEGVPLRVCINCWGMDQVWVGADQNSQAPIFVFHVNHPGVLRALIHSRDPLALVEAYINGYLNFAGSTEDAIRMVREMNTDNVGLATKLKAWFAAMSLPRLNIFAQETNGWQNLKPRTPERDKLAVQHHYDVGNDFYRLWLDPNLLYSCAHFNHPDQSLEAAQNEKLDIICRKLNLKPEEQFLDVGCGWGALVRFAAKNYGVKACGITVSAEQFAFNKLKVTEEGLQDRVKISFLDYRQLPDKPSFDKASSVGMIEHVGISNYPLYFSCILKTLKPGGLFLNHGISTHTRWDGNSAGERFIHRYIFPDGDLARLSTIADNAEQSGWEIVDVECWRPHYARTLRAWAANLERVGDQAVKLIGAPKYQLWRLYLLGSAMAFENNHMTIFQTLLRRREDSLWNLPLNRAGWLA